MTEKENEILAQIQQAELEIMDRFDAFCTAHGLRYSMIYGTLIGALRHQGFIPWDDDIDLMMPREDYEKLIALWERDPPEGFVLQNTRNSPDFTQNFTKIRKDHTTFVQSEAERTRNYHKGIFVDIFPCDRVAPTKMKQKLQYAACAVDLLYSRRYTSGSGGMTGKAERLLLKLPEAQQRRYRDRAEKLIRRWNGDRAGQWMLTCTIKNCRRYYPADLFDNMKTISFCGRQYQCVAKPEAVLDRIYRNFRELPSEDKRVWRHHPIVVDFEHNYEELESV